jgi:poly(3-hydroxybutyrate) depolymerase
MRSAEVSSPTLLGQFVDTSHINAAGTLRSKLYVLSGYTGALLPLVVMPHGGRQGVEDFAVGMRMNELAEQKNFLGAYPAQSAVANPMRSWGWFQADHQQCDRGEPSLVAGVPRDVA